jgi:hypothetical protein
MSFKEFIMEQMMQTELFEMAHSRQKALDLIRSLQGTIATHFIKVALFPDHQDYKHWCFELETYFSDDINEIRLKPNNRKLKSDDYFDILFDEPLGHENAVAHRIKSLYKLKRVPYIPNVDMEDVRLRLRDMYEELSSDLFLDTYDGIDKYTEMLK